ncbi:hypothetical protein PVAND_006591 [Polypedilum vanderplanki]|uniref:Uncharacterized protein n=1 Tax=Polypedilum vanderplanki TaxID=319348 RepID=A0A9J6C5C7_POLVA|nr:hypothetical protein PVAND_006591 [Polypedilum vanderplanki]
MTTPSQPIVSESSDFYHHQHHHFPYHYVSHHQYYPHHMHCDHHNTYGTTSGNSGKTHGHHTYQTVGPPTISSSVFPENHSLYAKPDNMGNIEIIDCKKSPNFDEMNNEL